MTALAKRIASALILAATALPAGAASVVQYQINYQGRKEVQTAYVDHGKVAMRVPADDQPADVLYRRNAGQFIVIEHRNRSYLVLDEQKLKALAAQVSGVRNMIMKNTTPEQQQQIADMLESMSLGGLTEKPAPMPKRRYQQTNQTRTVSSYPCRVFRVTKAGQPETELCVANRKDLKLSGDDYQTLRAMNALAQRMATMAATTLGDLGTVFPDLAADKIAGLPISVTDVQKSVTVTLIKITQAKIDPARLEVPAGYKETALPSLVQ